MIYCLHILTNLYAYKIYKTEQSAGVKAKRNIIFDSMNKLQGQQNTPSFQEIFLRYCLTTIVMVKYELQGET